MSHVAGFRLQPAAREKIVEELKASGLSGYGGAGFPTGLKWEAVAKEPAPRYVVVNADEGEPGTIKDRYVMELRPHLMLEGTLIAMDFAEATEGFIYLREEYATARDRYVGAGGIPCRRSPRRPVPRVGHRRRRLHLR
jgi:formate dehydrogenase